MKKKLASFFINLLPKGIINRIEKPWRERLAYLNKSYSQEGEDMILARYLGKKDSVFYIDVGAHHPKKFSNTYQFYKKESGRGVNIDALPGTKKKFDEQRPKDINIECGVGLNETELDYYSFVEPAINTFDKSVAEQKIKKGWELKGIIKIPVRPLSKILDEINITTAIDFLSIDVEGKDLEVLKSNNWDKYKPRFILIEDLKRYSIKELFKKSELNEYLESIGYELVSKTFNTLIYKRL